MYLEYKQYIKDELFFRPYGVHGIGHTKRVLKLAMILADKKKLSDVEKRILALAACYHDIGRTHDYEDEEHGFKSVQKVQRLKLLESNDLKDKEEELILKLIGYHSIDDKYWQDQENLLLYQILKDADALDRVRFGNNDLDPRYLRLTESKGLIDFAQELYLDGCLL